MAAKKRKNVRVKLPIRRAVEVEMTLRNARDFCGMRGASSELMEHLGNCITSVTEAINNRNRVLGLER